MKKNLLIFALIGLLASPALAQTLTSITIIPPATGFYTPTVGSTMLPTANCGFSDGTVVAGCAGTTLTWGSNDTNILTVNSTTGLTTNVSTDVDNAFAEVFAYNGHVTGHHNVAFTALDATTIVWQPSGYTQIITGTTVIASPAISDGGVGYFCAFASSNTAVATVNTYGEVTGIGPGTANITCTIGTASSSLAITVVSPTQTFSTWYAGRSGGAPANNSVNGAAVIFADGTVDADCPTSGSGTFHCAFDNPMWLFTNNTGGSYTGVVQSGDTAIIHNINPQVAGTPNAWPMVCFSPSNSTCWNTPGSFGAVIIPSGTPAHHTKILGASFASCSQKNATTSNRTFLYGQFTSRVFDTEGEQNIDFACLDIGSYIDCQSNQLGTEYGFGCGAPPLAAFLVNNFSANINFTDVTVHGWQTSFTGTPGPGMVFTDYLALNNWSEGLNYAEPFTVSGQQADGFEGHDFETHASGYTEEQPKLLSSVSRDGSGHLTVNFAPGAAVNYLVSTNVTMTGMTPSDLNGTYPVSAITFNQQSVSITGGSCVFNNADGNNNLNYCTFNTSTAPAFGRGAFAQIAGTTISGGAGTSVNGTFEVFSVTSNSFTINASPISRPGWGTGTIAAGGTAATANTLTATASGAAETATTLGVAGHVNNRHRGMDQGTCALCNGDGFGAGDFTRGVDLCDHCTFANSLQDGYDNLHGGLLSSVVTNTLAYGNEGAGVKVGNADILTYANVVAIGNCGAQLAFDANNPPDFNQYIALPCRANGAIGTGTRAWTIANLTNISSMTGFDVFISNNCSDGIGCQALPSVAEFTIQNSNFVGFVDPAGNNALPAIYFNGSNVSPAWTYLNNNGYRTSSVPWSGSGNVTVNPQIVTIINDVSPAGPIGEAATLNWNMNLLTGSPMIGAGIENAATPTLDFNGNTRPNPPSIGAYELISGTIRRIFRGVHH